MGKPGPREAIEAELARAGCKLGPGAGGLRVMDCPDQRARVRALDALAWHDARYDPAIRRIAADIARGVVRTEAGKVDVHQLGQALHRAVTERVAYLGEGAETFQTARETWEYGQGDCDDSARLLLALCRSVALPARLAVLAGADDAGGDLTPTHASVQIAPDGRTWMWAEPSLRGAAWGEEPKAAARRLRAGRGELVMGEAEDDGRFLNLNRGGLAVFALYGAAVGALYARSATGAAVGAVVAPVAVGAVAPLALVPGEGRLFETWRIAALTGALGAAAGYAWRKNARGAAAGAAVGAGVVYASEWLRI